MYGLDCLTFLALTVLHVPSLLDRGTSVRCCRASASWFSHNPLRSLPLSPSLSPSPSLSHPPLTSFTHTNAHTHSLSLSLSPAGSRTTLCRVQEGVQEVLFYKETCGPPSGAHPKGDRGENRRQILLLLYYSPAAGEREGNNSTILSIFSLKMAQAKAGIWL